MLKKTSKSKNFHLISPVEQLRFDFFKNYISTENELKFRDDNLNLNIFTDLDFCTVNYLNLNNFTNSY
jgi:hypothetical protein